MSRAIMWFRRDLRLHDNSALFHALNANENVLPIFIFDTSILDQLPKNDARVSFIHESLEDIQSKLNEKGKSLAVFKGTPEEIFKNLISENKIETVYTNHDYEPYAIERDKLIQDFLQQKNIPLYVRSFIDPEAPGTTISAAAAWAPW